MGPLRNACACPGATAARRRHGRDSLRKGNPWHRVVGGRGKISSVSLIASMQRKLLESEGIANSRVSRGSEAPPLETTAKIRAQTRSPPEAYSEVKR